MSTEEKAPETVSVDSQLIESVRKQIEYYFSKENLQTDVYLTSQMDAQMSVPITTVMKFAKLKALTQDESVVRKALEGSTLTVIDNRIKANIKASGRSTIILREIPSDAPEEEVKEIFSYEGCKPISSIRSDIGDTWFVVMETEEDAKDTALDLRLKKRTFRGQPVKARIKTEQVVRSFYPVQPVVPPVYPMMPFAPITPMGIDMMPFGFIPTAPEATAAATTAATSESAEGGDATAAAGGEETEGKEEAADGQYAAKQAAAGRPVRGDGRRVPRAAGGAPRTEANGELRKRTERRVPSDRLGKDGKVAGEARKTESQGTTAKPPIEVNAMTFPPLHGAEDTPVPTPGYKDTYVKYSFDEIINIVKLVKEAALPVEVKAGDHPIALTTTPNLDLLKRQRTFSIDETREQLRQGRPVQREAIISGAVDYRSFVYGDDSKDPNAAAAAAAAAASAPVASSSGATEAAPSVAVPSSSAAAAPEGTAEVKAATETVEKEQQPAVTVPATPTKISSSTWAAMVKSSAAATNNPADFPAPVTTTTVPTVPRSATKAKQPAAATNNQKSDNKTAETTTKPKAQNTPSKANKNHKTPQKQQKEETTDKDTTAETAVTADGEVKEVASNLEKVSLNNESSEAAAEATSGSGWGGKTSFASVLKQKLAEDPTTEEVKAAGDAKPVASSSADKTKNNNRNKNNTNGTEQQRFKNNTTTNSNNYRQGRNNNQKPAAAAAPAGDDKKASRANAEGMWVKETLPALPAEK